MAEKSDKESLAALAKAAQRAADALKRTAGTRKAPARRRERTLEETPSAVATTARARAADALRTPTKRGFDYFDDIVEHSSRKPELKDAQARIKDLGFLLWLLENKALAEETAQTLFDALGFDAENIKQILTALTKHCNPGGEAHLEQALTEFYDDEDADQIQLMYGSILGLSPDAAPEDIDAKLQTFIEAAQRVPKLVNLKHKDDLRAMLTELEDDPDLTVEAALAKHGISKDSFAPDEIRFEYQPPVKPAPPAAPAGGLLGGRPAAPGAAHLGVPMGHPAVFTGPPAPARPEPLRPTALDADSLRRVTEALSATSRTTFENLARFLQDPDKAKVAQLLARLNRHAMALFPNRRLGTALLQANITSLDDVITALWNVLQPADTVAFHLQLGQLYTYLGVPALFPELQPSAAASGASSAPPAAAAPATAAPAPAAAAAADDPQKFRQVYDEKEAGILARGENRYKGNPDDPASQALSLQEQETMIEALIEEARKAGATMHPVFWADIGLTKKALGRTRETVLSCYASALTDSRCEQTLTDYIINELRTGMNMPDTAIADFIDRTVTSDPFSPRVNALKALATTLRSSDKPAEPQKISYLKNETAIIANSDRYEGLTPAQREERIRGWMVECAAEGKTPHPIIHVDYARTLTALGLPEAGIEQHYTLALGDDIRCTDQIRQIILGDLKILLSGDFIKDPQRIQRLRMIVYAMENPVSGPDVQLF